MKLILLAAPLLLFLSSCANQSQPAAAHAIIEESQIKAKYRYYSQLKSSVEPRWIAQMNEAKAVFKHAKIRENNISKVSFEVDPNGAIKNIKIMEPSLVPQADKLAMRVIQNTKKLPKPPADILQNGKTQMEWEFVLSR